jgi:hypothetical protein
MSAPPTVSAETAETVLPPQPSAVTEPTPLPTQPRPPTKPRMLYIDNLRIVIISMVVLRTAITYGATGDQNESTENTVCGPDPVHSRPGLHAGVLHISSYFARRHDRKGRGRCQRQAALGIPSCSTSPCSIRSW